jgi:hypothetical protein
MADVQPPNPILTLAFECAEWEVQEFPMAGGDVLSIMHRLGLITEEQAEEAIKAARLVHGNG